MPCSHKSNKISISEINSYKNKLDYVSELDRKNMLDLYVDKLNLLYPQISKGVKLVLSNMILVQQINMMIFYKIKIIKLQLLIHYMY